MEELRREDLEELVQELAEENGGEEASRREARDDALRCLEEAGAAEARDEFETALVKCDLAIQLNPGLAEAHNLRGIVLEELGRTQEAVAAYREAARLDPGSAETRENLQELEAELKRDRDWLRRYEREAAESTLRREGPETISQQEGKGVGWVFWLLWVIASAAGLVLGSVLESVFTIDLSAHMLLGGGTTGVLAGLAVPGGLVVGTCQWLVLRRELDRAGWWILASTPMLIMGQLSSFQAGLTVRGIGVGLAQWLVLGLQVPRAGWWILVCVLGWTIGMAVGNAVAWEAGWFLANALAGAVAGAITGAGLVWLLRQ